MLYMEKSAVFFSEIHMEPENILCGKIYCSFMFLIEVFPCFILGCKANARVYLAKTGHGPHSS